MANQRDADKALIGAYVPKRLKKQVQAIAKTKKKSLTDVVKKMVERGVEAYDRGEFDDCEKKGLTVFNTLCQLATA